VTTTAVSARRTQALEDENEEHRHHQPQHAQDHPGRGERAADGIELSDDQLKRLGNRWCAVLESM
jgi:hypothetical protein